MSKSIAPTDRYIPGFQSFSTLEALGGRWAVVEQLTNDYVERILTVVDHQPRGYIRPQWSVVVRQFHDAPTGAWSPWHVGVVNHTNGGKAGEWLGLSFGGADTDEQTSALIVALEEAQALAQELNA